MQEKREIVFYDGECGFCSNSVQFILKHEKDTELQFCPLQSDFAITSLGKKGIQIDLDTIYVYSNGEILSKSTAIQKVAKHLKKPYGLLSNIIGLTPRFLADLGYEIVAKNRYAIQGKAEYCILPDGPQKKRFLHL